jgi:F-type H+-transporting ATPase subunit b
MDVLTNIGFDWQVALANFISFLLIFWILKRYAFGPIGKIIDERKKIIEEGVNKAEQSETELLVAQQKADETLKTARTEANQIVARAKENGDTLVLQAETAAKGKADEFMEQATKNIEKQKNQMEEELLEKTAHLVVMGVSKILDTDVDANQNEALNKRALKVLKESK